MFIAEFDLEGNLAQLQRGTNTKLSWKPGFVLDEIWALLPPPCVLVGLLETPGLAMSVLCWRGAGKGCGVWGHGLGGAMPGETLHEQISETSLADNVHVGKAWKHLCC